jgi:hypothetical protein
VVQELPLQPFLSSLLPALYPIHGEYTVGKKRLS